MAQIDINGTQHSSYASLAEANDYLGADLALGAVWIAREESVRNQSLVSATRYLRTFSWTAGEAPIFVDIPDNVRDATSILAALVATDPSILDGAAGESNVKRVGAGSAQVEFFGPTRGRALPRRVIRLLGNLIGGGSGGRGAIPFDASAGMDRMYDGIEAGLTRPLS